MLFNPWPDILQVLRKQTNLSQENAAERAEVSIATWYRWESGRTYPGPASLQSLAQAVNIGIEELGLIYAEALVDHYQDLARDCESGPREAEDPTAVEHLVPLRRPGSDRTPAPARIRAIASEAGSLWVDVSDFLTTLDGHRSETEDDPLRQGPAAGSPKPLIGAGGSRRGALSASVSGATLHDVTESRHFLKGFRHFLIWSKPEMGHHTIHHGRRTP